MRKSLIIASGIVLLSAGVAGAQVSSGEGTGVAADSGRAKAPRGRITMPGDPSPVNRPAGSTTVAPNGRKHAVLRSKGAADGTADSGAIAGSASTASPPSR